MKKLISTFIYCFIFFNSFCQETNPIRNSVFFHGGIGIPISLSTRNRNNSELFKIGKSLWNVGLGLGYSRNFTKNLSYLLYVEIREYDFDNEELGNFIQTQEVGYSVIPYHGGDMFFSYTNTLIGLKYGKTFKGLWMDIILLTGPTFYFIAEPTVNLKEIGSNNILTYKYSDCAGLGYSINPQLHIGYHINERVSILIRSSYLESYAKIKYHKKISDLTNYSSSENIESKQKLNAILGGIGLKLEF